MLHELNLVLFSQTFLLCMFPYVKEKGDNFMFSKQNGQFGLVFHFGMVLFFIVGCQLYCFCIVVYWEVLNGRNQFTYTG